MVSSAGVGGAVPTAGRGDTSIVVACCASTYPAIEIVTVITNRDCTVTSPVKVVWKSPAESVLPVGFATDAPRLPGLIAIETFAPAMGNAFVSSDTETCTVVELPDAIIARSFATDRKMDRIIGFTVTFPNP